LHPTASFHPERKAGMRKGQPGSAITYPSAFCVRVRSFWTACFATHEMQASESGNSSTQLSPCLSAVGLWSNWRCIQLGMDKCSVPGSTASFVCLSHIHSCLAPVKFDIDEYPLLVSRGSLPSDTTSSLWVVPNFPILSTCQAAFRSPAVWMT